MTTQMTKEALLSAIKRKRHDWKKAVMRSCDYCGHHSMTVTVDLMATCAECCDKAYSDHIKEMVERAADELEAKDKLITAHEAVAMALRDDMRLAREKLGAAEKRNAEQADIIAKQEKWIKDVEETMIAATDRAESAEQALKVRSAPVGDLVILIKVLVRGLKKTGRNSELCESAMDYLRREKLISAADCLRDCAMANGYTEASKLTASSKTRPKPMTGWLKSSLTGTTNRRCPARGINRMKRENRYFVLKVRDIETAVTSGLLEPDVIDALGKASEAVIQVRRQRGKDELACVVVESDWPEHEIVWGMIEARVDGVIK